MNAATESYEKLESVINALTQAELETPFDFSSDVKKKEAHWNRDPTHEKTPLVNNSSSENVFADAITS